MQTNESHLLRGIVFSSGVVSLSAVRFIVDGTTIPASCSPREQHVFICTATLQNPISNVGVSSSPVLALPLDFFLT